MKVQKRTTILSLYDSFPVWGAENVLPSFFPVSSNFPLLHENKSLLKLKTQQQQQQQKKKKEEERQNTTRNPSGVKASQFLD
jgi:hypothetical protein